MGLADSDAPIWLLMVQGFWEVIRGIFIPLLTATVAASVALLAIHKTDKRERDKRRRDDVIKAGVDFSSLSMDYTDICTRIFYDDERDTVESGMLRYEERLLETMGTLARLSARLRLVREEDLADMVANHLEAMRDGRTKMSSLINGKSRTLLTPEPEEAFRLLMLEMADKGHSVFSAFAQEVARLDRPGEGMVSRWLSRF